MYGISGRPLYYRLEGDRIEPVGDWLSPAYMAWSDDAANLRIGRDEVTPPGSEDTYLVSTVFLRMDHNYSSLGPPVLFETMVFRHWRSDEPQEIDPIIGRVLDDEWSDEWSMDDLYCDRYTSRADAEAGHRRVVERMTEGGLDALYTDDQEDP